MSAPGETTIASVVGDIGDTPYTVEIAAGHHRLLADEPKGLGGGDTGPSPFGYVLSGLAACSAITLRMYCERKEWPPVGVHVGLTLRIVAGQREIERVVRFGEGLDEVQVKRLAEVVEKTPVTLALKAGMTINTTIK
ncbi:MAG: OsmC family protein [Pseudomonadota bacterium]|uniref:OsmC family protein n=1 Tax=Phenylobacterium sp. TaxID=1871053 RepID=UPI00272845F2|nr:OsmC family protein [Phenylobacterium sp.]MDO9432369.1 OsmC family protein [Phenylobacterium sp.]